jgi:hypothetical protein
LIFKEIVDEVDFASLLFGSGRGSAGWRRTLLNDGERISWSFMFSFVVCHHPSFYTPLTIPPPLFRERRWGLYREGVKKGWG